MVEISHPQLPEGLHEFDLFQTLFPAERTDNNVLASHGSGDPLDDDLGDEISIVGTTAPPPSYNPALFFEKTKSSISLEDFPIDSFPSELIGVPFVELQSINGYYFFIIENKSVLEKRFRRVFDLTIVGGFVGIPLVPEVVPETLHCQRLIGFHLLAEESSRIELGPNGEHDLFLDAPISEAAAPDESIREINFDFTIEELDAGFIGLHFQVR